MAGAAGVKIAAWLPAPARVRRRSLQSGTWCSPSGLSLYTEVDLAAPPAMLLLSQVGKPLLKLTGDDYNENSLQVGD